LNVKRMVNAIRFMLFSWNKTDLAAVRKPHFVNRSNQVCKITPIKINQAADKKAS
jgi:hypothetical protein